MSRCTVKRLGSLIYVVPKTLFPFAGEAPALSSAHSLVDSTSKPHHSASMNPTPLMIVARGQQIHQLKHTTTMSTPIGKIFTLDRANWSPEDRDLVSLPAGFQGHMVLVFDWPNEGDWVRIVTVSSYHFDIVVLVLREKIRKPLYN